MLEVILGIVVGFVLASCAVALVIWLIARDLPQ